MKKLIALCAVALTTSVFAADSYLYWMVGDTVSLYDASKKTTTSDFTGYTLARVGVLDSSGASQGYLSIYGSSTGSSLASQTPGDNTAYYASLGTAVGDGYSYYIELLNDSQQVVGRSTESLTYSTTVAQMYITSLGTSTPAVPWTTTSFTTQAIPEPTSGMLLLLGLAGLALKRKRA